MLGLGETSEAELMLK